MVGAKPEPKAQPKPNNNVDGGAEPRLTSGGEAAAMSSQNAGGEAAAMSSQNRGGEAAAMGSQNRGRRSRNNERVQTATTKTESLTDLLVLQQR
jgi:hypothetical protein